MTWLLLYLAQSAAANSMISTILIVIICLLIFKCVVSWLSEYDCTQHPILPRGTVSNLEISFDIGGAQSPRSDQGGITNSVPMDMFMSASE
jgi:hypothetical protein